MTNDKLDSASRNIWLEDNNFVLLIKKLVRFLTKYPTINIQLLGGFS